MAVNSVSDRNYLDLIGSANSDTPKAENLAKKYGIEYCNYISESDWFSFNITMH